MNCIQSRNYYNEGDMRGDKNSSQDSYSKNKMNSQIRSEIRISSRVTDPWQQRSPINQETRYASSKHSSSSQFIIQDDQQDSVRRHQTHQVYVHPYVNELVWELFFLRDRGSYDEYYNQFVNLVFPMERYLIPGSEEFVLNELMKFFVDGLQEETRLYVCEAVPRDFIDAMNLANYYEDIVKYEGVDKRGVQNIVPSLTNEDVVGEGDEDEETNCEKVVEAPTAPPIPIHNPILETPIGRISECAQEMGRNGGTAVRRQEEDIVVYASQSQPISQPVNSQEPQELNPKLPRTMLQEREERHGSNFFQEHHQPHSSQVCNVEPQEELEMHRVQEDDLEVYVSQPQPKNYRHDQLKEREGTSATAQESEDGKDPRILQHNHGMGSFHKQLQENIERRGQGSSWESKSLSSLGSNAGVGDIGILQNRPLFRTLPVMAQENPQVLQPMLQELGKQNSHIMKLVQEHQGDFKSNNFHLPTNEKTTSGENFKQRKRLDVMKFHPPPKPPLVQISARPSPKPPWKKYLDDIFNNDLLKDKIAEIPDTFNSMEAYLSSFMHPLLEEVCADLCSCPEAICKAFFTNLFSVNKLKPLTAPNYRIRVETWLNASCKGEVYKPKKDDLFVLSNIRPMHSSDLSRYGNHFNLALVTKGGDVDLPPNIFLIEISWDELDIEEQIGAGLFGTYYHAEWHQFGDAVKVLVDQDFHGDQHLATFIILEIASKVLIWEDRQLPRPPPEPPPKPPQTLSSLIFITTEEFRSHKLRATTTQEKASLYDIAQSNTNFQKRMEVIQRHFFKQMVNTAESIAEPNQILREIPHEYNIKQVAGTLTTSHESTHFSIDLSTTFYKTLVEEGGAFLDCDDEITSPSSEEGGDLSNFIFVCSILGQDRFEGGSI